MQKLILLLGLAAAACGGGTAKGKTGEAPKATGPGSGAEALPDPANPTEYCDAYRACAEEQARNELRADLPDGQTEVDPAKLAAGTDERVEACRTATTDLDPEQWQWLQACTACGGSCDVYRCFTEIPTPPVTPYQCTQYPEIPPGGEANEPDPDAE